MSVAIAFPFRVIVVLHLIVFHRRESYYEAMRSDEIHSVVTSYWNHATQNNDRTLRKMNSEL